MTEFFRKLFDTSDFPARWHCGNWSSGTGWLHIASDIATFGAYVAIPVILLWFVRQRKDLVFPRVFWLFAAFIFACGAVHLVEAIIFWHPIYRFAGVLKLITAIVSWVTVAAVVRIAPQAADIPSLMENNQRLEAEVRARCEAEERLKLILDSMSEGVMVSDPKGNLERLNPAAQAIFRFSESEMQFHERFRTYVIYGEDGLSPLRDGQLPLHRAGRGESIDELELRVACESKEIDVPILLSARPLVDADGEVCGGVAVFRDLTEQKTSKRDKERAEIRRSAILQSLNDGVVSISHDGQLEFINRAAESLLGNEVNTAEGSANAFDSNHPVQSLPYLANSISSPLVAALYEKRCVEKEVITGKHSTIARKNLAIRAMPVRNHEGTIDGAVAVLRDITDAKKAEVAGQQQIKDLEELTQLGAAIATATQNDPTDDHPLLKTISEQFESDLCAMVVFDGEYLHWQLFRSVDNSLRQKSIKRLRWTAIDCLELSQQPQRVSSLDTPLGKLTGLVVIGLKTNQGTGGALLLSNSRYASESEPWSRLSRILSPVIFTRQRLVRLQKRNREMTAELDQARADLDRLSKINTFGELTAGIAHELNQPLTAIANYADAANVIASSPQDDLDRDELRALTESILREAGRTGEIFRSIRAIVERKSGSQTFVNLKELVEETLDLCAQDLSQASVLTSFPTTAKEMTIVADRTQIQQLLVNLLSNAAEAVSNCHHKKLSITVESHPTNISLIVADSGTGLPTAIESQLFEPFVTARTTGIGLGLSICRSIAELHGGHIEARNSADGGAVFTTIFPNSKVLTKAS